MAYQTPKVPGVHHIDFEMCSMEWLKGGQIIGLKAFVENRPFSDIIFHLDESDIGVNQAMSEEEVFARAKPIFEILVKTHNRARQAGFDAGQAHSQREMRVALGIEK